MLVQTIPKVRGKQ